MKYTFINQKGEQQTVVIPEEVITKHKRSLGCNTKEAIELFLFDEGYIDNAEVDKLTDKASQNKYQMRAKGDGKRKAPSRKPDEIKRGLIDNLHKHLLDLDHIDNVEVTNPERIIAFTIGDDNYELTLSKKRKKAC